MDEVAGPPCLDSIFEGLGREIRRPLDALRDGLERMLSDPDHPAGESDRAQAMTLLTLCEDLRQLTEECMGGADIDPAG